MDIFGEKVYPDTSLLKLLKMEAESICNEENTHTENSREIFDLAVRTKHMYDRDNEWVEMAYMVVNTNLIKAEVDTIKAVVGTLIEQFLKNNEK
ncbi:MAG: hypothetical protein Q8930_20155 [Bacillota bacterium]|nr:hypothetical protein [Bacillota bacterium]